MAIGKNKRLGKGRKGGKKKIVDPFTKKEWYDIKAPAYFKQRMCGKTPISRTAGTKIASEEMKGRVFEVSLGDLSGNEDDSFKKIKLVCEEVQGKAVLCNFYGMSFTRDKLCSLVKKWQTLIEAYVDAKTTDGYTLRLFCIGFTKKMPGQTCKTSYAQASQERAIRLKMVEIMAGEVAKGDLKELVHQKLITGIVGKEIEKQCRGIYPMQNVFIRKVKILKFPKFDLTKLMELHNDAGEDTGAAVEREESAVETLTGSGGRL
jgi:small subunit ribosomal protein S3Ae